MPFGLQTFDSEGDLMVDTNDRLGRLLGYLTGQANEGTITDDKLLEGTPWAVFILENTYGGASFLVEPVFDGNTMSWSRTDFPDWTFTILYGVF